MKKEGVEESTLPGSQRRRYHASFSSLSPAPFSSLAAALPWSVCSISDYTNFRIHTYSDREKKKQTLTVVRLVLRLQQLALLPAVRLLAHPPHLLGCRILLLLMALPSAWCSYSGVANQSLFTLSLFLQRVCCLLLQSSFFDWFLFQDVCKGSTRVSQPQPTGSRMTRHSRHGWEWITLKCSELHMHVDFWFLSRCLVFLIHCDLQFHHCVYLSGLNAAYHIIH